MALSTLVSGANNIHILYHANQKDANIYSGTNRQLHYIQLVDIGKLCSGAQLGYVQMSNITIVNY